MNAGREADECLSILRRDQCHTQLYRLFIRCPRSHLEREGAVAGPPGLLPDCKAQRKSPGQVIGVCAHLVVSNPFATPWIVAHRLLCPWNCPGNNTGVGCHFLPEGIFLTQGSNSQLCVSCTTGRCFATAPPGTPQVTGPALRTSSPLLLPGLIAFSHWVL